MDTKPLPGIPLRAGPLIRPERCEKCRRASALPQTDHIECRRNPPTASTFPISMRNGSYNLQTVASFPRCAATAWCGEFRPLVGDTQ